MSDGSALAAVFLDFENVYYHLKEQLPHGEEITDSVVSLMQEMRRYVLDKYGEQTISMDAYADWERIEENAQGALYLLGVETHNVLGTDHKNAADMRLCIDALDVFYNRRDIQTFVLIAGDRDYIPLIQHLKKRGKTVRVVGFPKSVSGDLLTIVGSDYYVDATQLVAKLGQAPQETRRTAVQTSAAAAQAGSTPKWQPHGNDGYTTDWARYEDEAIDVLFRHYPGKREVYLVPYLHKLRAEMSELTESERKLLITRLSDRGAYKVEKRPGTPNDFSVIVVNWNHPMIRAHAPA